MLIYERRSERGKERGRRNEREGRKETGRGRETSKVELCYSGHLSVLSYRAIVSECLP